MDDLIGGLFIAMAAAAVVAIAIAIAMTMVLAGASVGALVGSALGVGAFSRDFGGHLVARGGPGRLPKDPEPAFELYVLGQLRRDLFAALGTGWQRLQEWRQTCSQLADRFSEGATLPLAIGIVIGGWAGTVIAAVLGALVAAPVIAIAAIFSGAAWMAVGVLRGVERARRRLRRAHYECPEDHERFPLPVYVCPSCGAEHHQLVPGRWGVLRRECRCRNTALPTMVINGRQRVPQQCPSGHAMSGLIGFAENLRVALVGGPSAGKSTFLAAAMMELEQLAATGRFAIDVADGSRASYDASVRAMTGGTVPPKTMGKSPALVAEVQGEGRSRVLYAYDVAGESYGDVDAARELRFLEVPSGLVLLVDPLAIPHVAAEHSDEIEANKGAVLPSSEDPMRVLERTVAALAEAGVEARKMPVAVVLAKVDAFGIGDEIEALSRGGAEPATRAWLVEHGAGNLVRAIEQEFKDTGWFASSALGRVPSPDNNAPFVPTGAVAPLLWVLQRRGVTPASKPFQASNTQQQLAAAGSFPPIDRRGWSWRIGLTGAATVALLAAAALGVAALAGGLGGGGGSAVASGSGSGETDAGGNTGGSSGGTGGTGPTEDPKPRRKTAGDRAVHVARQHLEDIDSGDYDGAFRLMTESYRAANPHWVSSRADADPAINVLRVGSPKVRGDRASVKAHFYARDRFRTDSSDTTCREFRGRMRLVRVNRKWRYEPSGGLTATEHDASDPDCPA